MLVEIFIIVNYINLPSSITVQLLTITNMSLFCSPQSCTVSIIGTYVEMMLQENEILFYAALQIYNHYEYVLSAKT